MPASDPSQVSSLTQLISAVPVAVGGAIGILGGLAAARYGSSLTEARESRRERCEKLERLVHGAFELDIWLKHEQNWVLFKGPENLEPCPMTIVQTLATLHFPSLVQEAEGLANCVLAYRQWLHVGRAQMTDQNLQTVSQAHLSTMATVYTPFVAARQVLISKAQSEMPRLLRNNPRPIFMRWWREGQ